MSNLINLYKQKFGEALEPLGFKHYRNTFYRVFSEVIQMLMIDKHSDHCTIEFNIRPLAWSLKDLYCDGYQLFDFHGGRMRRCVWWFENLGNLSTVWYDPDPLTRTEFLCGSMADLVEDMLSVVAAHVLPAFERGTNARTAYEELVNIEKAMHGDDYGPIIESLPLALLCIHAGDYNKAHQHMELFIKRYDRAYAAKAAERETEQWNEYRQRSFEEFMSKYQEYKELLHRLSIPDTEYLNDYVAKMTEESLECIRKPRYPGPRKRAPRDGMRQETLSDHNASVSGDGAIHKELAAAPPSDGRARDGNGAASATGWKSLFQNACKGINLEFSDPITGAEIKGLEDELGVTLSGSLLEALKETNGIRDAREFCLYSSGRMIERHKEYLNFVELLSEIGEDAPCKMLFFADDGHGYGFGLRYGDDGMLETEEVWVYCLADKEFQVIAPDLRTWAEKWYSGELETP